MTKSETIHFIEADKCQEEFEARQAEFNARQAEYEALRVAHQAEYEAYRIQAEQETRKLKKLIKSIRKRRTFGNITFDEVWCNAEPQGSGGPKFDIVLLNSTSIVLVKVKPQARVKDITKLTTTQVRDFKTCYPHYTYRSIYCALATLVSNDNLAHHARKAGVLLITQQGKDIVINGSNVVPIG